jgi:type IV pilus assembly protein PilW
MTRTCPFPTSRRQRGVGLVEVMVALTVGLFLLGALSYLFLGSRQLNRTHGDVSRMQESGRIAMEILGRAIRQAGARQDVTAAFAGGAVTALDATEVAGTPDTLTVRYDVQDGGEADCLGNTVATGRVTYVFAIDTAAHTLTCTNATGGGAPAPVVVMDNIENMQITFGIDGIDGNSARDGVIDSYRTLTEMATPTPPLTLSQVAAVRVSLLARGPTAGVATGTQTYTYNGASVTTTDGFLRQVYNATFTVRNQAI